MTADKLILVSGATGYVGGRLLPLLVEDCWRVRCLARRPEHLLSRVPAGVEVVQGDVLDAKSLVAAMEGAEAAFYLVHSMGATGSFEEQDRQAAENFGTAAPAAGVKRIIYLGGLGEEEQALSAHLRSRHEVGERLRASGVPVVEFRASIIIGSGSLSFEMIRALVERLPVMVTLRWVRVLAQPLAVSDVLAYLRAALSIETAAVQGICPHVSWTYPDRRARAESGQSVLGGIPDFRQAGRFFPTGSGVDQSVSRRRQISMNILVTQARAVSSALLWLRGSRRTGITSCRCGALLPAAKPGQRGILRSGKFASI